MAWQKNKILLVSIEPDKNGKKQVSRYVVNKSKGKGKPSVGKMEVMKYHKELNKHTLHKEVKYK
ncbi:50S ribosomal protein L33 [Candidatus Gracilibacteria bacterium]|nr:50S ribosomal protein L33 [Candidatus Gracilibacteria bacterium]